MEMIYSWPVYAAGIVCCCVAVVAFKQQLCDREGERSNSEAPQLTAVELAYLLREGDMGHCIAVLVVDVLQRCAKECDHAETDEWSATYTRQVLDSIKTHLRAKAEEKTREIIDYKSLNTPTGLILGVRKLHLFFVQRLRPFFTELVRDPKNLKRYFNPAGIIRVLVDVYAAGIKTSLERDLSAELIKRGLLVPHDDRLNCSATLWRLSVGSILVLAALLLTLYWQSSIATAAIILVAALINGIAFRVLITIRQYVPFYEEIAVVLRSVVRGGIRLTLLRALFGSANTLFNLALTCVILIVMSVQLLLLHWFVADMIHVKEPVAAIVLLLLSTLQAFLAADAAFKAIAMEHRPQPTIAGRLAVHKYKQGLEKLSPITLLSESFSNNDYDERLSMVVSLYGIETLWFLF
jgi:hypothetical protein